ncbi:DUF2726 domain-containing protein [Mariprofundus sp. NF]|uniref:DUF2726 domain-containing protein n=1 Tax=Mariprofundus sp. NF TaxID=2608716 RepID=UPI0015A0F9FD|nr:DUF2726 domain-containing protein [Mariprofundus sp. NF]NWF37713.1 DUF2726 domain-containing protein [Mariprofundus sp. NF]
MPDQAAIVAIILAALVAAVLIQLLRKKKGSNKGVQADMLPMMQATAGELSVVEQCCLQTLQQVAGEEYHIRSKVALCAVATSHKKDSQKLLDFVLFSKESSKAACVIQLQSVTQRDESSAEQALLKAGIRLYRLPRKSSYSISSIRQLLDSYLEKPVATPDEMIATISTKAFRQCKKCKSPMVLKRASAGPHTGMLFWVCAEYPECASVELYTE